MSYNAFPYDLFSESRAAAGGKLNNAFLKAGGPGTLSPSGGTVTLMNYTGGQPGYACWFWLAIGGIDTNLESVTIQFYVDGEVTPSVSVPLTMLFFRNRSGFFATDPNITALYASKYLSATSQGAWSLYLPVPFSQSLRITLTNPTTTTYTIWSQVSYMTGVPNQWPYSRKLAVSTQKNVAFTPYQSFTLLNYSAKPGRLWGVYMAMDGLNQVSPAFAWAEGEIKINLDGSSAYTSSGTEDYFASNGYWVNTTSPTVTDYWGLTYKNAWAAYAHRFHVLDPIMWDSSITLTWDAGYSTAVAYTGNGQFSYTLLYYTY